MSDNKYVAYKQVSRIQLFGDDNINNSAQFQYAASGTGVNNSIRMRFNLKGVLSTMTLSRNARAIMEMACIPTINNMGGRTVIVRLVTSTQDKVCDTKKFLNGNPILFCMPTYPTVGTLNTLYNATEFFYNINVPSNFLTLGYIDMELECPSQTSSAIDFITSSPLNNFYVHLVIIDEDLERTYDSALTSNIEYKNNIWRNNLPINFNAN
jgi:hypothetical protein